MWVEGRKGFLHTQQRPGSVRGHLARVEPPALSAPSCCCLSTSSSRLPLGCATPYSSLAFLLCSQRPSSPFCCPDIFRLPWVLPGPWHGLLMGSGPLSSRSMPSLPELPNEFLKIKPFLPPCALSILPSVLCPALESGFLCMTPGPNLSAPRGPWWGLHCPHCPLTLAQRLAQHPLSRASCPPTRHRPHFALGPDSRSCDRCFCVLPFCFGGSSPPQPGPIWPREL